MLVSIGEERDHFGYDAIRDRYVDDKEVSREKKQNKKSDKTKEKEGVSPLLFIINLLIHY
ncbi:MAG: hypothetical protein IKP66_04320 [Lachnospiraceae bacterium]|nr:hypothetical protein [Lachnospiraceae bacterium]